MDLYGCMICYLVNQSLMLSMLTLVYEIMTAHFRPPGSDDEMLSMFDSVN